MASVHVISKGPLRMQLNEIAGNAVAVYPAFKRILKLNSSASEFLSQAVYWTERTDSGWFYKTADDWYAEICLSPEELRLARRKLVAIGVLSEKRKGVPAKMHFRVDLETLFALLKGEIPLPEIPKTPKQDQVKPDIQSSGNPETRVVETLKLESGKPTNSSAGNPESITENTQETTAETTADIIPAVPADAGKPAAEFVEASGEAPKQLPTVQPVLVRDEPRCEIPDDMPGPKDPKCKTYRVWANYAFAYRNRYGVWPVWNAAAGGMLGKLIDHVGADEAPKVAAFYVGVNDSRLINDCHSLNILIAKASAFRTQWATGRQMNSRTARQMEDTQANMNAAQEASRRIMEKGERNEFLV